MCSSYSFEFLLKGMCKSVSPFPIFHRLRHFPCLFLRFLISFLLSHFRLLWTFQQLGKVQGLFSFYTELDYFPFFHFSVTITRCSSCSNLVTVKAGTWDPWTITVHKQCTIGHV